MNEAILNTPEQVKNIVETFKSIYTDLATDFVGSFEYDDVAFARHLYEHLNDLLAISTLSAKAVYRVKTTEAIERKRLTYTGAMDDILGVRVLVNNSLWSAVKSTLGLSDVVPEQDDGISVEESYYFKSDVTGVPAWELQVVQLDLTNLETYILQQSGVVAEVHRRLRADEWDERLDDVREFIHEHHELMERLADYDK
ncbi:hypothetical protein [Weissella confusa]|uniref:hypothetical protein n=1 Tax=Weissella confusa TaxID=1583 RepID=UPI0018F23EB2|nr:hypothetical protein [Weissella confusa]MBJ7649651.1 hypothetical protein [Weissella confusa]